MLGAESPAEPSLQPETPLHPEPHLDPLLAVLELAHARLNGHHLLVDLCVGG